MEDQRNKQPQPLWSNLIHQPAISNAKRHQAINASLENIIWQQAENKWLGQINELRIESSPAPKISIFKKVNQKSHQYRQQLKHLCAGEKHFSITSRF
jgi:hypothetical protein